MNNSLAQEINDLENEILNYKTNLIKETAKVYTYTKRITGTSRQNVRKLTFKFKDGFSPILSIYATGTLGGKSLENTSSGLVMFSPVNAMNVSDIQGSNLEYYATLAFAHSPMEIMTPLDYDITITIKTLSELERIDIGDF